MSRGNSLDDSSSSGGGPLGASADHEGVRGDKAVEISGQARAQARSDGVQGIRDGIAVQASICIGDVECHQTMRRCVVKRSSCCVDGELGTSLHSNSKLGWHEPGCDGLLLRGDDAFRTSELGVQNVDWTNILLSLREGCHYSGPKQCQKTFRQVVCQQIVDNDDGGCRSMWSIQEDLDVVDVPSTRAHA